MATIKKIWRRFSTLADGAAWYARDVVAYRRAAKEQASPKPGSFLYWPKILDRDPGSHTFDAHYTYQERWAVQHLMQGTPSAHVDVGSSVHFLSMASLVTHVTFVDIRPVSASFSNFKFVRGNVLALPFASNSQRSVSCLHVVEHIGLGRYGDALDPDGTMEACAELSRILAPGGNLYVSLPIGKSATYFNAHRVHTPRQILAYFAGLELKEFCAVDDGGKFMEHANPDDFATARYGCGMFSFTKPSTDRSA